MFISGGEKLVAGPLDVLTIGKTPDGKFFPMLWEEHPVPGPIEESMSLESVRLKSKGHCTNGLDSVEAAVSFINEHMIPKLEISEDNIWLQQPVEWNGTADNLVVPNWKKI